jgi:hypothetical protein
MSERRNHQRYKANVRVLCRPRSDPRPERNFFMGMTENISHAGCRIYCLLPLSEGDELKVHVGTAPERDARVMWCRPVIEDRLYEVGLELDRPAPLEKNAGLDQRGLPPLPPPEER